MLVWFCSPGGDVGEKDVDIDDDQAPTKFAPVVIDKGRESSSSGSDSSDSGSSDSGKRPVNSWLIVIPLSTCILDRPSSCQLHVLFCNRRQLGEES